MQYKSHDLSFSEVPYLTDFLSFLILPNSYWILMMLDSISLDVALMVHCVDVGVDVSRCDNLCIRVCFIFMTIYVK